MKYEDKQKRYEQSSQCENKTHIYGKFYFSNANESDSKQLQTISTITMNKQTDEQHATQMKNNLMKSGILTANR